MKIEIKIRRAEERDIPGLNKLLFQVLEVHHRQRPDLFRANAKKYTDQQLKEILSDDSRPVFVAVDQEDRVLGYAFCVLIRHREDNILTDINTLYLDDLCVDEGLRGQQIGTRLYDYVTAYAKSIGCYNLTLNVWASNEGALKFYEARGLKPQKLGLETIL